MSQLLTLQPLFKKLDFSVRFVTEHSHQVRLMKEAIKPTKKKQIQVAYIFNINWSRLVLPVLLHSLVFSFFLSFIPYKIIFSLYKYNRILISSYNHRKIDILLCLLLMTTVILFLIRILRDWKIVCHIYFCNCILSMTIFSISTCYCINRPYTMDYLDYFWSIYSSYRVYCLSNR